MSGAATQAVRAMLSTAGDTTLAELERALSLQLTGPQTAAERRVAQLGTLTRLLRERDPDWQGNRPPLTREEYDERRVEIDPMAPAAETLAARYGSWLKACRAAHGLLEDGRYTGSSQPWAQPLRGRARLRPYTLEEVHAALRRCALELGRVPSSGDYHWWTREKKRLLRQRGIDLQTSLDPQHRIPGIGPLYRYYGKGRAKFQQALADARLNPVEIAAARAKRLLAGIQLPAHTDAPKAELLQHAPTELAAAGVTAESRKLVDAHGFGPLPISQAAAVARLLECALDWLAGCSLHRGEPPTGSRLDTILVSSLAKDRGVSSRELREALSLPTGPFRRIMSGSAEPTLAEVAAIAACLHRRTDEIITRDA